MKIYRVIFKSIDIDESDHTVRITTFFNRDNALRYYKELLEDLKEQQEELDMGDYSIDEDETSYERYLDGRAMEQSVSLMLEEADTYDEIETKNKRTENEKDKDYEI